MGLIKLHLVIAERSGQPHIDLFGGTALYFTSHYLRIWTAHQLSAATMAEAGIVITQA